MNYRRRLNGLQSEMIKKNIDLVLYGAGPNFQYLTGLSVNWRIAPDLRPSGTIVFIPINGDPILLLSEEDNPGTCPIKDVHIYDKSLGYSTMIESIIDNLGIRVSKIALGSYLPVRAATAALAATGNPEVQDASNLMDHLRMIKEPEEIELLRQAAQLTDEVMLKVVRNIKDGVSQFDLILEIEMQARRMGASDVSFPSWACFVKSGSPPTDQVSDYPVDKGLAADTAITFDVGFVMNGYCSDWGRSVYWGTPPAHAKKAHAALRTSVVDTVAELKDGNMKACDIYPAIEKKLDALGFADRMRARLASVKIMGHQIGTEVHEDPWLRPDVDDTLRAGMVMCIEPKLWFPGEYYFRLEEMVHITETGAEFLTNFDREMFEL